MTCIFQLSLLSFKTAHNRSHKSSDLNIARDSCIPIVVQYTPISVVQVLRTKCIFILLFLCRATDQRGYISLGRFILIYYFHWVQAVLVTLAREVELLSTSLKKAGWSVPDVTDTMKMGLSAVR